MKILKTKFVWLVPAFFMTFFIVQAQMTVTGTVTDPDGFEVPNALIELSSNPDVSTVSDTDGSYSITIPESEAVDGKVTLVFSTVDMDDVQQTIDYSNTTVNQNVAFSSDSKSLTGIVAVGYGTIKEELATSAVDVVDSNEFNKGYVTNADQLIQGKVAGVSITSDGSPQGGSVVRIRGGSSLSADQSPLIIIDGLPLDTKQGVSFLNPNDIESVSVLKDAASTAIYGNRGANGVIIYTTKKGSKDRLKVNYNSQYTINSKPYSYNNLSAGELTSLIANTDWASYGLTNPTANLGVQNVFGDPNSGRTMYDTNWMDLILKESFSTNQNLSLSGNLFKVIPTRFSTGYTANNGILITSGYQRVVLSTSMNPTFFNNSLKVNLNANTTNERFRFADQGQLGNAFTFDPTKPVKYDGLSFGNGYFQWANPSNGQAYGLAAVNPYAALIERHNQQKSKRYFGNLQLDYTFPFLQDLRFVINGGLDHDSWHGINNVDFGARSSYSPSTNLYLGNIENYNGYRRNKSLDTYFVYTHQYSNFNMEVTAGYAYQNFFSRDFNTGNQTDNTRSTPRTNWDRDRNYTNIGYFGRFNFDFNKKYLFNVNLRYDGTSKFGKDNQFAFFPGVSGAWVISKEDFMASSTFVNNLKLRASFGRTGNQSIPAYQFIPLYYVGNSQSSYLFGNNAYLPIYPGYYNPDLKWELTDDWNIGLDYEIINRKLKGSFDYYNRKTKDLLADVNIAPGSNFANQGLTNQGDFTSKGVDIALDWNAVQKDQNNLVISFNAGYNRRVVNSLGDGGLVARGGIGGLIGQNITYDAVGYAPQSFYVYEQVYDANNRPIEGVYVDRNNDRQITEADKYFYKNPFPKWVLGFRLDYEYKNWSFVMNWRAHIDNYVYNNLKANNTFLSNVAGTGDWVSNITSDYYDDGFVQKSVEVMQSDYFIENGSFLKLDNLSVAYNVHNLFGENTSCTISLSGNNLLISTKSNVKDPEVYSGIYNDLYPRARTFVLGLNLNF